MIFLIVDGDSEYASLPGLFDELRALTGASFTIAKFDIQPLAPVGTIVRQCSSAVRQAISRGASSVVVLLDQETRSECPGQFAQSIASELRLVASDVEVVVKTRTFENWVVADIVALRTLGGMFTVSQSMAASVQPNKADNVSALKLLQQARQQIEYDKVRDAKKIMAKANVTGIGEQSRSFRRLLRQVGCASYKDQSRLPVAPANGAPPTAAKRKSRAKKRPRRTK
jgi:hypothetical protein